MSISKVCLFCNASFICQDTKRKYCSYPCSRKDRSQKALTLREKTCLYCGKIYSKDQHKQKYCSRACQHKNRAKKTIDNFWNYVDKSGGPDTCWDWQGTMDPTGYGHCQIEKKHIGAHRLSYMLTNGDIPKGMFILHSCDRPRCVNPAHLRIGTPAENTHDMFAKGRQGNPRRFATMKLDEAKVKEIRRLYASGQYMQKEIAKLYNVSKANISGIIHNKKWSNIA